MQKDRSSSQILHRLSLALVFNFVFIGAASVLGGCPITEETDAGNIDDAGNNNAGNNDAGSGVDGDAGAENDAGGAFTPDSGPNNTPDAGADAGADASSEIDAGTGNDAGSDAGNPVDAGNNNDAGNPVDPTPETGPTQCNDDGDCASASLTCNINAPGGICLGCGIDDDCGSGFTCVFAACVRNCSSDDDCNAGFRCNSDDLCVLRSCNADADCAPYVCGDSGRCAAF